MANRSTQLIKFSFDLWYWFSVAFLTAFCKLSTAPSSSIPPVAFDTQHEDMIHDAAMDYYGKRLATASSDRTIRIFQVEPNLPEKHLCSLTGHEGPVWQVAWAHPKFGSLLASCSYDGKVFVWKETSPNAWIKVKEHHGHESSVNSISWAPHDFGLALACASSDGLVSVLTYLPEDATWSVKEWAAHPVGCNSVCWSPTTQPDSLLAGLEGAPDVSHVFGQKRLVSGGCDNQVKIWKLEDDEWKLESDLSGHSDWVRDVAWAPNVGVPMHTIVSCSQDRTVLVWKSHSGSAGSWTKTTLTKEPFSDTLWRVTFAPGGNILAVAGGDNHITLWREAADGEWQCLSNMDQSSLIHKGH